MNECLIKLDPESPEPLYLQLQGFLREKIVSGEWPEGHRLPTYRELTRLTGVSMITVQQAIDHLVNENILYRRQGRGTFVATRQLKPCSMRIGLFLPNLREPFFSYLAQIIQTEAINFNFTISVFSLDDGVSRIARAVELLVEQHVDGLLTTPAANAETLQKVLKVQNLGIPCIMIDGHHPSKPDLSYVECDNRRGIELMVDHFLELGHQRIGFASEPCYTYGLKARLDAFGEVLEERGLVLNPSLVQVSHLEQDEGGWDALHKLMAVREPPTAVACATDVVAAGALRAAKHLGLRVPDDLSVAGFDDLYLARHLEVPLTTIRQPASAIGAKAVQMLVERIQQRTSGAPVRCILSPELVIRESTGVAPEALPSFSIG